MAGSDPYPPAQCTTLAITVSRSWLLPPLDVRIMYYAMSLPRGTVMQDKINKGNNSSENEARLGFQDDLPMHACMHVPGGGGVWLRHAASNVPWWWWHGSSSAAAGSSTKASTAERQTLQMSAVVPPKKDSNSCTSVSFIRLIKLLLLGLTDVACT